jgi:hypothetical protein
MALTNNNKLRYKNLTIVKKVNGSVVTTDGFPLTISFLDAFSNFSSISVEVFQVMTNENYLQRLNSFYTHLETIYPFWLRSSLLNENEETNAIMCPLDNSLGPEPIFSNVFSSMAPANGGTTDNYLEWGINLTTNATADVPYFFDIDIYDKNDNIIRTETVFGIISKGNTSHYSGFNSFYISEADDMSLQPLRTTEKPESVVFN